MHLQVHYENETLPIFISWQALNWQLCSKRELRGWFSRKALHNVLTIIVLSPHGSEVVSCTCYCVLWPRSVKTCWALGPCSARLQTDISKEAKRKMETRGRKWKWDQVDPVCICTCLWGHFKGDMWWKNKNPLFCALDHSFTCLKSKLTVITQPSLF